MVLDLNTATKPQLRAAGLTDRQVTRTLEFRRDNAVFHSKKEWKEYCNIPDDLYEQRKDTLVASKQEKSGEYETVSRATYRRRENIRDPNTHVSHIIAEANGGADHPANYVLADGRYNQQLQHLHDGVMFAHMSEERLRKAIGVSRVHGYRGTYSEALQKKRNALLNLQQLNLYREGLGRVYGGDETDGNIESRLSIQDYCRRLIEEWKRMFPV